jgi:predicted ATPase
MRKANNCQVIMATHSPIIMACPGAELLELSRYGLYPAVLEDIQHFRIWKQFCDDPKGFIEAMLED